MWEWWESILFILGIGLAVYLFVVTGALKAILSGIVSALLSFLNLILSALGSLISAIWLPVTIIAGTVLLIIVVKKTFFA